MIKKRYQLLLIIGVLALAIVGTIMMINLRKEPRVQPPEIKPPLVRVRTIAKQEKVLKVSTYGTVRSGTEIMLSPQVSGRVISVFPALQAGGAFEKDEVLFEIDPLDYETAVTNTKVQVAQAKLRLVMEKAESRIVCREWESMGQGEASSLVRRELQLVEVEASLNAAKAALEQAERNLRRTKVRAPFAGRVKEKMIDVGQLVSAGTPVASIYATDYAEIRLPLSLDEFNYLDLPLDYHEKIHSIPPPEVLLKGNIGEEDPWSGHLVRTEAQVDAKSRMIYVVARVKDPYAGGENPPLVIGLFVQAEITGQELKDVFVLPRSVIRGKNEILIVDKENRLHRRTVDIYRAEREEVIIRSGLKTGDRICLTPLETVVEGMQVRVIGSEKKDKD